MRVSISVTNFSWPSGPGGLGAELVRLVRAADQAGVDTVWVADHLIQADPTAGPDQTEMLEAYTTLGFLAAQTQRVRLGTMVSPAALRPPVDSHGPGQRALPPILIGGADERRTLRLVARSAAACRRPDIPDGGRTVRHKLAVLAGHCADVGRPYEAIQKTLGTRLEAGESSDQFARRCRAAAALGIEHVAVITPGPWKPERLATLAAAIPTLREVQP